MYGLDAIDGWSRILACIPIEFQTFIDNAKAQVDFWVNFGFMCFLLLLEYLGIAYYQKSVEFLSLFFLIFLAWALAPYRATQSAVEWGELVKSVFDLYRYDLLELLHIEEPISRDDERLTFTRFSQAIVYQLPRILPNLKG